MSHDHFVFLTFPVVSHFNPAFQFAKRLLHRGVEVTIALTHSSHRRVRESHEIPEGLQFVTYSDGYDDGLTSKEAGDVEDYLSSFSSRGSEFLASFLLSSATEGRHVTCVVYTIFIVWAAKVARDAGVPSVLLWIQPATVLDILYYNFSGYEEIIAGLVEDASKSAQLPGLPMISKAGLPLFFGLNERYKFVLRSSRAHIDALNAEEHPTVLVNTFFDLEPNALRAVDKLKLIPIGPLLPPVSSSMNGGSGSAEYMQWLDSNADLSVIYISFGSLIVQSERQNEELAAGLLAVGRPFLWVIRTNDKDGRRPELSRGDELGRLGMIVNWCLQVQVLSHRAVGCFVTHFGWNSTLEGLVCGVPMVGFPQWFDQTTNAMLVEDVWRVGLRLRATEDDGVVESNEIRNCVETVMAENENGAEMRENAIKWKKLASDAGKVGGASDESLDGFLATLSYGNARTSSTSRHSVV